MCSRRWPLLRLLPLALSASDPMSVLCLYLVRGSLPSDTDCGFFSGRFSRYSRSSSEPRRRSSCLVLAGSWSWSWCPLEHVERWSCSQSCAPARRRGPFGLLYAPRRLLGICCQPSAKAGLVWGKGGVRVPFVRGRPGFVEVSIDTGCDWNSAGLRCSEWARIY